MFPQSTLNRLQYQLDSLNSILRDGPVEALTVRGASGQWSAHENLAHLARHHDLFLDRIGRILAYQRPNLGRYSAEQDPKWVAWSALSTQEVLDRLHSLRQTLFDKLTGLSEVELLRTGTHGLLGEMDLTEWLEFFLLHEAHHLYLIMLRVGEARRAAAS